MGLMGPMVIGLNKTGEGFSKKRFPKPETLPGPEETYRF